MALLLLILLLILFTALISAILTVAFMSFINQAQPIPCASAPSAAATAPVNLEVQPVPRASAPLAAATAPVNLEVQPVPRASAPPAAATAPVNLEVQPVPCASAPLAPVSAPVNLDAVPCASETLAPVSAPVNLAAPAGHMLPSAATNRHWSSDRGCVLRAALLSRIVYFESKEAEEELNRYRTKFGFMVVQLQGEAAQNVHKMVVARDHNNTLYLCFGGTYGIADLITKGLVGQVHLRSADLRALDNAIEGSYHEGFLDCLEEKVVSMKLLIDLVRSRSVNYNARRVVFCGHSVGGALAHLALVKYMLANASRLEHDAEVAAIAFGAPHVCDEEAREYLSGHRLNIERKIYNFVSLSDPVPFLLKSLPYARQTRSKDDIETTMIYRLCGVQYPQFQQTLDWLKTHAVSIPFGRDINQEVIIYIRKLIKVIDDGNFKEKARECKWYVPIGNLFTDGQRMETDKAGGIVDKLHDAVLDDMCHENWRFSDEIPVSNSTSNVERRHQQIRTAAPKISSAVYYAEEKKMKIVGQDLELTLQALVDGKVWEHELPLTDRFDEIHLTPPSSLANENILECITQNDKQVQLVTCFGDARHHIRIQFLPVSVIWPKSHVAKAYQRCVLKLGLVMRSLPDEHTKFEKVKGLIWLRMQKFLPSTQEKRLGILVSQIWPPAIRRVLRESVFEGIDIDIQTEIGLLDDIGTYTVASASAGCAVGIGIGGLLEAGYFTTIATTLGAGVGFILASLPLATFGAVAGAGFCMVRNRIKQQSLKSRQPMVVRDDQKTVRDYMDVLHLTSLVLGLKLTKPTNNDQISKLERRIGDAFRKEHNDLRDSMRRDLSDTNPFEKRVSVPPEYGIPGATITTKSMAKCVDRAEFVHDVFDADHQLSRKVKVMLFEGDMNKSIAELAISVAKWTKCHKQILVLNKQILVLNKCDQVLSNSDNLNELNPKAMREIRAEAAKGTNLKPEDVMMTVLQESVAISDEELKKRDVLRVEEARSYLRKTIKSLNSHNEHGSFPFR
ncbi:hypothetical protein KP509_1Z147100 [Ceratopteris richardii]|nr:hypothetical protein KP509_1Z147100 [Ceratopteris richardii]